ncbi:metallophosphoesterase [Corallococcus sp. bb12-1]|uniref:metallophosphoesterase family protein n=1 Tax=Corallococcus sp. bb12-1 TaxID=2996784 RepID=UPI00226ED918|nr:metallophosphoesterase [Corallococcus sp. bb12-1]MCY1041414.1 metallophosphoesterase [Corallococcus sp. bb12-1]
MPSLKLAHLSDLHLDMSRESDASAASLVKALATQDVDHVVVTGDLTHRGSNAEFQRFREHFAPWMDTGRLTFIPGNHDRPGEDVGSRFMEGRKVHTVEKAGLFMVCVDSTGDHNRNYFSSHGELTQDVVEQVENALSAAPRRSLVAVLLHHHVLPLPLESFPEWIATKVGLPHASELALGKKLLERVSGKCDLVLHGHRHIPHAMDLGTPGERPLRMFNSGSSTDLGRFRVFSHMAGRLVDEPTWCQASEPAKPRTAVHNVRPALQYLVGQLGMALF